MRRSSYFPNGITNGADWYVIYGGMQDWNYVWMGCSDSRDGNFQITIPTNSYVVEIRNDRYAPSLDTLLISSNLNLIYHMHPYIFVLDLDFENENGEFNASDSIWQWGVTQLSLEKSYSNKNLWGTSLRCPYPNHANAQLVLPYLNLPDVDNLIFSFWHWMEAETDNAFPDSAYDGGLVDLSTDNGMSWTQIFPRQSFSHRVSGFA